MKAKSFWSILVGYLLLCISIGFAAAGTAAPTSTTIPDPTDNELTVVRIRIPDAEPNVLEVVPNENAEHYILDVWKEGDDFRILVGETFLLAEGGEAMVMVWRALSNGAVGEYTILSALSLE